ncbi:hypothetical protein ABPG75_000201 [Micractinium tetrahymenae]
MHCHDIGLLSVAADQAMERQGIKWQAASALVPVLPHLASTLQLLAGTDSSSRFLQDGELVNKAIFNPWALIVQQLVAWPLHSAACRAAQWAAQEQEAPHSLLLGAQLLPELLALLSNSFSALAPANEPHGAQRWSRAVQGAAAAHWQALQALTAAAAPQGLPLDLDFGTATFLAEAACSGPTAIAHSPALLSLFCDLLRRLAQRGNHRFEAWDGLAAIQANAA